MAPKVNLYNSEGYFDPTAYQAMTAVLKEQQASLYVNSASASLFSIVSPPQ